MVIHNNKFCTMGKKHAPLTVYKASAGSGKTFRLAVEYIKLLVDNPHNYRTILAVTFTNKATEEMKMRILGQLYGIWKELSDSDAYLHIVSCETGLPTQVVRERAGVALRLLLHHYSYFRIETIDSFFQTVLRNLARELDLPPNFNVALNDKQVMELAVDRLIDELEPGDEMLGWMMNCINQSISEDKSWNVIRTVKEFGQTIFKDFYKLNRDRLNALLMRKGFYEEYVKSLRRECDEAQHTMGNLARKFFTAIEREGLTINDFAYRRSGVCSIFLKLQEGDFSESIVGKRVLDCMDDAGKWVPKTCTRRATMIQVVNEHLLPLLTQAVELRPSQWRRYQSAKLTLRHLGLLRLLERIDRKVSKLNEEANRFMLSDTQTLLHSIMQGSDSPFIFEKIGTRLEHIMIDEFQDTSTVQWGNFKVLLKECMSHEQPHNLIVGDVKQSIYRWRSGDWRLLNDIDATFGTRWNIDIRDLTVNFRSSQKVVTFNNHLFSRLATLERETLEDSDPAGAAQLAKAYADVCQSIPKGRPDGGYVEVRLLPRRDYETQTFECVVQTVSQLVGQGVRASDIAILVRSNKHIPLIANILETMIPQLKVVSDEAFRLDASLAVNILVTAMRLLAHPDDPLAHTDLVKAYRYGVVGDTRPLDTLLAQGNLAAKKGLLPETFEENAKRLRELPLPDLSEALFAMFELERLHSECAYVSAFHDCLSQFIDNNVSAKIDDFIAEWENTYASKTIQSDEQDGVRILSIHKSKGLEFDHVIVPFCDWQLERTKGNVIWCSPHEQPFSALPLVPVNYGLAAMQGTVYEQDYRQEHLQNVVDNLNLLYVALTRAGKHLYVFGKRDATNSRSTALQKVLAQVAGEVGASISGEHEKEEELVLTYGNKETVEAEGDKNVAHSNNVFLQKYEPVPVGIEICKNKTEYKQSNKSKAFVEHDDDSEQNNSYITIGSLLHNLFACIPKATDLDCAIRQAVRDGLLDGGPMSAERIKKMFECNLRNPQVAEWFDGSWQLHNECSIITTDDKTGEVCERRPDRVMTKDGQTVVVDFKFGQQRDEHRLQVAEYIQLLRQMGSCSVSGYLWYVYEQRVVEVTELHP